MWLVMHWITTYPLSNPIGFRAYTNKSLKGRNEDFREKAKGWGSSTKVSKLQEETSESSCEDEENEMTIMAKRYKKLVLHKS